ncbi:MAG: hypothetical protein ACREOI_06015 [bacterium]
MHLININTLKNGLMLPGLLFLSLACDKSNPVINDNKPPCPGIVPTPPYNSPVWHPSGKFIGFNHAPLRRITFPYGEHCTAVYELNGDSSGFWLINPDGTNQRRIFPYQLQTPAWSPDGQWIAFVGNAQIYKMQFSGTMFDTTSLTQLTFEGRNFFPAWSPDGQWIAYDSNSESPNGMNFIWSMKADGSQKRRIAYEPMMGEIRMPHWSPDGQRIVHQRYVGVGAPEIFTMDISGSNPIRLTNDTRFDSRPQYSPDGTKIVFWSQTSTNGIGNLWKMNGDGSNLRQLTIESVDATFGLPFSWSPDGSAIAYTYYRVDERSNNNGTLWIIDIATGKKRQLTLNQPSTNLELSALRR